MFTGIIQAVGKVVSLEGGHLVVDGAGAWPTDPVQIGESIAVNGACLTAVPPLDALRFDLSEETLRRTALGSLGLGHSVNLERALRPNDRLGGHFVQGHVDTVGELVGRREEGNAQVFTFRVPEEYERYVIDKGSIAVNGVSLTVVEPRGAEFDVWVIPHTLENTALRVLNPGDRVNLEFDMLAKYVEQLLSKGHA